MTYFRKRSMTSAEDGCAAGMGVSRVRILRQAVQKPTGRDPWAWGLSCLLPAGRGVERDLRADPAVGVNLQQQRVAQAAVDDVRLADAAAQALQARLDLGDHPLLDHPAADQLAAAPRVQAA